MNKKTARGKFKLQENVEYVLRDKDGNIKPLFQENKLGRFMTNKGLLSPYKAPAIPLVFGSFRSFKRVANAVTNVGFAGVASRINGAGSERVFDHIAIGTGTASVVVGDIVLQHEIEANGGQRTDATLTRVTTDTTDDTAQLVNTFTFTSPYTVTESGVFNSSAADSGVLLARQTFGGIATTSGDSLQVLACAVWQQIAKYLSNSVNVLKRIIPSQAYAL